MLQLLWPLQGQAWATQEFGEHKVDYSRYGLLAHNGLDLGAALGTPVIATHDGATWVYEDPEGYGNVVELWTPEVASGIYKTISAHLSKILVAHGVQVKAGTVIGLVGSTGNSTGPHLHYSVKMLHGKNPGYRDWIDPRPYLPQPLRGKTP